MTLSANSNGVVTGAFTIPANVLAGSKEVRFVGAGGSQGSATFFGQGTRIDDVRTVINNITTTFTPIFTGVDPLAQTFTLSFPVHVDGVDLFFRAVGTTPVIVQIRETSVGIPTQTVVAEARLDPSEITNNAWNRFNLRAPVYLPGDVEYAIVVLCNDAISELAVSELGKFDAVAQRWVTSQPYTVGVLLASSNASTWTPYQDRDLTFRLVTPQYTQAERLVDLGTVNVTGATDLLLLPLIDSPTAEAVGHLEITLPNGTVLRSGDNQRISLSEPTTGTITIKARVRSDEAFASAVAFPGVQVIQGIVQATGTYISRAIDADATGCTAKVVFDAIIPSGANVTVEVAGVDAGDAWLPLTAIGVPKLLNADLGLYEYQFSREDVMEARLRARLTLSGTVTARPRVRNLRLITF